MSRLANILLTESEPNPRSTVFDRREIGRDVVTLKGPQVASAAGTPDLRIVNQWPSKTAELDGERRVSTDPKTALAIVIILGQTTESDRVADLELGASSLDATPLSVEEIVLRANAVLRRWDSRPSPRNVLEVGSLVLDADSYGVTVNGHTVSLTPLEFKLLWLLASSRGAVLRRETLLRDAWGDIKVEVRTVDQHVKRLRVKLGPLRNYVKTIRGIGYSFDSE